MISDTADIASVVGAVLTVVGFSITIVAVIRSKNAATQAKEAAEDARNEIKLMRVVEDFSSALFAMAEIKTLHRKVVWELLPDRYSALRKSLISIRMTSPNMSASQKTTLQNSIQHFSTMERQVDTYLQTHSDSELPDTVKFNAIISKEIDRLQVILVEIKEQTGR